MTLNSFISVIIPTRDNHEDLCDCLSSIALMDRMDCEMEVIIWDNNSGRKSREAVTRHIASFVERHGFDIRFVEHDGNFGVYTSRDELLKIIHPEVSYILSLDDDVILPFDYILKTLPHALNEKCVGIIGPKIVYDASPSELAHGASFVNWWLGRYSSHDLNQTTECDYVIGCCMLINRAVIDAIGGFDRDYYTSHGEVDFCVRAKQHGFKVLYTPEVMVRHRVDRGGTKNPERLYYIFRNKLLLIKKNAPRPQKWFCLTLYLLFWIPKVLLNMFIQPREFSSKEISMICKGMVHGWMNKTGKVV